VIDQAGHSPQGSDEMSKSTDKDTSGSGARTSRVGVYGTSDKGRTTDPSSETIGVYDRPANADRSRMTPTVIAVIAAIIVAILLLLWVL
jgi:hypothetical protein